MQNNLFAASFRTILLWLALVQLLLILLGMVFILRPVLHNHTDTLHNELRQQLEHAPHQPLAASPSASWLWFNRILQNKLTDSLSPDKVIIHTLPAQPDHYAVTRQSATYQQQVIFAADRIGTRPGLTLLLSGLFFLTSLVFVAWHLARKQQQVYEQLGAQALRIGQGEYRLELPDFDVLEIRELFEKIQRMSQQLALAEQEKSILLAGISHDIRTPITRLHLLLALHESALPEALQEQIEAELQQVEQLLHAFMEHARQRGDEVQYAHETLQLQPWLQSLLQAYRNPRLHGPEGDIRVNANPLVLQRVLQNLIDNALKYTEGPVELQVHREGTVAIVEIRDQGEISTATISQLEQAFSQGQNHNEGYGLGLHVVRYLCRSQHWGLHYQSHQPQGLKVRLELPLKP